MADRPLPPMGSMAPSTLASISGLPSTSGLPGIMVGLIQVFMVASVGQPVRLLSDGMAVGVGTTAVGVGAAAVGDLVGVGMPDGVGMTPGSGMAGCL